MLQDIQRRYIISDIVNMERNLFNFVKTNSSIINNHIKSFQLCENKITIKETTTKKTRISLLMKSWKEIELHPIDGT